jgi:hypothetical protein
MSLDLGNIALVIQIICFLLLLVGVYPSKRRGENKNLMLHGYLTIFAMALNLSTIFGIMLPSLFQTLNNVPPWTIAQSLVVWVHIVSGILSVGLGFILIIAWIAKPLGQLECTKWWRLMKPTLGFWAFALIFGMAIHIFEII